MIDKNTNPALAVWAELESKQHNAAMRRLNQEHDDNKTEATLWVVRVSMDVVVEAHNKTEADSIINTFVDGLSEVPDTMDVLGFDDIDWEEPYELETENDND